MADITKTQITHLQELCKTDLRFLCKNVLHMTFWEDSLHNDLVRELNLSDKKKLILMPRGHLKSTIVTVGWSIQQVLKDFNIRILITNAVWDMAKKFLREINGLLTTKSNLSDLFGQFDGVGSKFTEAGLTIAQRTSGVITAPTVSTAGIETALAGNHYDIIIHDDLVEESNINTPEQIQKVIRFYQNSLDLLDPGGIMIIIGTRWAMTDLYGHLIESEMTSLNGKPLNPMDRVKWRQVLGRQHATINRGINEKTTK